MEGKKRENKWNYKGKIKEIEGIYQRTLWNTREKLWK